MKKNNQNHNITMFLLLTFFIPFLCLWLQTIVTNSTINFLLFGVEAASPTITALLLLAKNHELRAFFKKKFSRKHLLMALILPTMVACFTMFLAKVLSCFFLETDRVLGTFTTSQFIIILWALIAEEIGWRGYLEPSLIKKGIAKTYVPMLVGIIWCLWHYHYFLSGRIVVPILLFLMSCIVECYLYRFFMDCTRENLTSAMMYHVTWNLFLHVFLLNPMDNHGSPIPYLILVIVETLTLFILYKWNSKRQGKRS